MAPDDQYELDMSAPHDKPLPDLEDLRMDGLEELDDKTLFEVFVRVEQAETLATAMQSANASSVLKHDRGYSIDRSRDTGIVFTHDEKPDLVPPWVQG